MNIPARTVLYCDSYNLYIFTPVQKDHPGSCGDPYLFRLKPPVLPGRIAIYDSFSVNSNIFYTDPGNDSREHITSIPFPGSQDILFSFFLILTGAF